VIGPELAVGVAQAVVDVVVPLAHNIGSPHQDPPAQSDSGGTSPVLIGGGIVATIGLAGGLFWVRERSLKADDSAPVERDAKADADQQDARPALEPGDHPRAGQEPA
jgi:hypothetical protein